MAWPRWFVEGGAERNSATAAAAAETVVAARSEEHTSELQSRSDLVCRLLLEKKNILIAVPRFMTGIGQSSPRQSSIVRPGDAAGTGPTIVGRAIGEHDLVHAVMPPVTLHPC